MTSSAIDPELWNLTRSGARAGRGFRYQDAVCALLSVQAWAGLQAWRAVVPEGADDASLHGPDLEIRVQIKSRHDPRGEFTLNEVAGYLGKILSQLPADWNPDSIGLALILERAVAGVEARAWAAPVGAEGEVGRTLAELLERDHAAERVAAALARTYLVVASDPGDDAAGLLAASSDLAPAAARLAVQNIRIDAGAAADANYLAAPGEPAALDASAVQFQLDAVSRLADPEKWNSFSEELCVLARFHAPVETTDFYSGVNVMPAHIGAGLVFERPAEVAELRRALATSGVALVAGPSGAGKSALTWLAAYGTRHAIRWYRVRDLNRDKVSRLLSFATALDVDPSRPVGFVVDDAGRDTTGGWDLLVEEASGVAGLNLLGSVREEDVFLLATAPRTLIIRPVLDAALAERIWSALSAQDESRFAHWVEPFEMSQGLMLEYTHILTEGLRLEQTLKSQVQRRLSEVRDDELILLERIVFPGRFGAAVDGKVVRAQLGWEVPRFARALARLVEEHAVRERGEGFLGGLHELRSTHLDEAIRGAFETSATDAVAPALQTVADSDLPNFIPRVLRAYPEVRDALLKGVVRRLAAGDLYTLQAALHGLGLATADQVAERWVAITRDLEIDDRFSALTFMLVDTSDHEGDHPLFAKLREARPRFNALAVEDLRVPVVEDFDASQADGRELGLERLHHLQAALMPLKGTASSPDLKLTINDEQDLSKVDLIPFLEIVRTTRDIHPEQADRLVAAAGGTRALLDRLAVELPWVTIPGCRKDGDDSVVEGYVHMISDEFQPDLNAEVVRLCELMLAAASGATLAIADVLFPDGRPFTVGPYRPNAKRIAREALPTPACIAWNRAQGRAIHRLIAAPQETGRTKSLAHSIVELSGQLEDAILFYLRQTPPPDRWKLLLTVGKILQNFVPPPRVDDAMGDPLAAGDHMAYDALHGFVTDIQTLITELVEDSDDRILIRATQVAKIAEAADKLSSPQVWRIIADPPLEALTKLKGLLVDLRAALGHIANDPGRRSKWAAQFSTMSRKHSPLARAAQEARETANRELAKRCEHYDEIFAAHGLEVTVYARPTPTDEGYSWPSVDYVAILDIGSVSDWLMTESRFMAAGPALPDRPRIAYAPRINGKVAPIALVRIGDLVMPHAAFETEWKDTDGFEIVEAPLLGAMTDVLKDLSILSGMAHARSAEANVLELAQVEIVTDRISTHIAAMTEAADAEPTVAALVALEFVFRIRDRVLDEMMGVSDAEAFVVEINRLSMGDTPPTEIPPIMSELIGIRVALMEQALGVEAWAGLSDLIAADDPEEDRPVD